MADGRVLAVGVAGDPGGVFAALAAGYDVHAEPAETMHWTWLDTADWRLHRAGLALREERRGRARELVLDRADAAQVSSSVSGVGWPATLDRLAPSPVRELVAAAVGVRALLPVAEVEARRILLRLRDDIGKTRVRVSVDQQRLLAPRRAALPLHVVVRALRGYDRDAQRCVELLGEAMSAEVTTLSPTDAALAAAGHLPPPGALAPVQPTDRAVRSVAGALLGQTLVVRSTLAGVLDDLDTEFLHDVRRAVRASRGLLWAVGELLPGRAGVRAARDLDWLEEITSGLRAVDAAILEVTSAGDLDTAGLVELAPLRDRLVKRRRDELRRLRKELRTPRGETLLNAWVGALDKMVEADAIGPSAAEAARTMVDTAYHALIHDDADLPRRIAAVRQLLATFDGVYRQVPATRFRRDLDEVDTTARALDRIRTVQTQLVAAACSTPPLPVVTVLSAGALLDRAAARERSLATDLDGQLVELGGARTARRVAGLTG